ncbi:hypothetical protein QET93_000955 [Akkermansia sp. N21116]|jgi:hypothetical protein|uniref:hypothetical protein n=1 Tax=Akkermansia sp. N21116 TaxID=3040764 RepID=UPI00244EF7A2|nr:hypothetical protein [Akkermansia sp. N21116]WPX40670.1 hypothetical protein QET93_000955 [Akkermansia sp. N21116]
MKIILAFLLMTMTCFSEQVEFRLIDVTDDVYNEILTVNKWDENMILKKPFHYCKINNLFSVIAKEDNDGVNSCLIYMYQLSNNGKWNFLQYCRYKTENPGKIPDKLIFDNSSISILSKNGLIVNKFDVSVWVKKK